LTTEQCRVLADQAGRMLRYLHRLVGRMEHLRFPHDDKLLRVSREAENAMHTLFVTTHYMSCRDSVGGSGGRSTRRNSE
jgi:hypothetical protein